MAKLRFKIEEVRKLMSEIGDKDKLVLVGDEGVYIMCFAQSGSRTIVYAQGCNPKLDANYYDNKVRVYGGSDGCDEFGSKRELMRIVDACDKYFIVNLTPTSISCSNDPAPKKSVKINPNLLPAELRAKLGI